MSDVQILGAFAVAYGFLATLWLSIRAARRTTR